MLNKLRLLGQQALWQRLFTAKGGLLLFPGLCGLLASCGFAPLEKWPLTLAGLALIYALLLFYDKLKQRFAALMSFGLFYHAASLWWLNFVLQGFGELPLPLSWLIIALFALYLSLPAALLGLLASKLSRGRPGVFAFCLLPAAMTLADYIIAWLFGGFPWVEAGYSALQGPLSSFAPLLGVHGINLAFYLCAGVIALTIFRHFIFLPAAGVIFILGVFCSSLQFTKPAGELKVSLVQGNIEQSVKWRPEMVGPTLAAYWQLSADLFEKDAVVIWPESAVPLFMEQAPEIMLDLNSAAFIHGAQLITGVQHVNAASRQAYNSLAVLGGSSGFKNVSALPRYDKRKLVPFGEFVPFADLLRPLGSIFNFPMSSFSSGRPDPDPLTVKGVRFIPAICFEAIFPELIRSLDSDKSGFIIMLSNDSWFGTTSGPLQHLNIARMRCLELQKPMLRATNSGVTAVIGADGRVLEALPREEEGVLTRSVSWYEGQTPYSRFGELPLAVLTLLIAAAGLWQSRKKQDKRAQVLETLIRP